MSLPIMPDEAPGSINKLNAYLQETTDVYLVNAASPKVSPYSRYTAQAWRMSPDVHLKTAHTAN